MGDLPIHIVLGGKMGGRPLDPDSAFEQALEAALGEAIRADRGFAEVVFGVVAGGDWIDPQGQAWGFSARASGDIIAAIRGEGDYCSWFTGRVFDTWAPPSVTTPMAVMGWGWRADLQPSGFGKVPE